MNGGSPMASVRAHDRVWRRQIGCAVILLAILLASTASRSRVFWLIFPLALIAHRHGFETCEPFAFGGGQTASIPAELRVRRDSRELRPMKLSEGNGDTGRTMRFRASC